MFLVPADTPGVTVGPKDHKMGQAGASTADVSFDDVRVAADALVSGEVQTGFRAAMTVLARGRVHIVGAGVGLAQRVLDESVAYAAPVRQGGVLIGERQLVQAMLAEQQAAGAGGPRDGPGDGAALRRRQRPADRPVGHEAVLHRGGREVADLAVQVHGGSGYMRETTVERLYRDVRLFRLYEGTSEIQKLIVGRELLKRELAR